MVRICLRRQAVLAAAAVCFCFSHTSAVFAYLGSFEVNDGYQVQSGTILGDVTIYNAGAHGANAGGGPLVQIAADSGLWDLTSEVGGYFDSSTDRTTALSPGPGFYPSNPSTGVAAYIVGNHPGGRSGGTALALRNDRPVGNGAMVYEYSLDAFDFGGVAPTSVTSGVVPMSFYFCPNPGDSPSPDSKDKFTMTLIDSVGNVGLQWGYARDNSVTWRTSASSPWMTTGVIADQFNYDGVSIDIDLTNDTFGIDYFDVSANTWSVMVPAGTAMGMAMQDLSVIGWQLEDGLFAGVGGKNFFDDFSFTNPVPEPATCTLALAMGAALLATYVRRQ